MKKSISLKILMVCLGNICRSPLAQGIMEQMVNERKLDWEIDSAGTSGWHSGAMPDTRSIEIAQKHHIDISNQKSRKIRSIDYEYFDYILVMDYKNYQDVIALAKPEEFHKIQKIMHYSNIFKDLDVPDPYYDSGLEGFEYVYTMLKDACHNFINYHLELNK